MSVDYSERRFTDTAIEPDSLDTEGSDHEAVPVAVDGQVAAIDRNIAELVWLTWRLGIETSNSCEDVYYDGSSQVLIAFPSTDDLAAWLSFVAPEDGVPGGLWDRATGSNLAPGSAPWEYDLTPKVWRRRVRLHVAVVFPLSDVPLLVERLKAAT